MKERPILFSAPMVRAILDGKKTQTRRAITPVGNDEGFVLCDGGKGWWPYRSDDGESSLHTVKRNGLMYQDETPHSCPYGRPGDRLWVRETWADVHPLQIAEGRYSQNGRAGIPGPPPVSYRTIYRADGEYPPIYALGGEPWPYRSLKPFERDGVQAFVEESCWTPSIHMPRWASRILLDVVRVRVERLNSITPEDAIAEGLTAISKDGKLVKYGIPDRDGLPGSDNLGWDWQDWRISPVDAYRKLWESINGAASWDANPWVWVVEFRRITSEQDDSEVLP